MAHREALVFNKKDIQKAIDNDLKIWVVGTREEDFSITQDYQTDCNFNFTVDIEKYSEVYKPFVTSRKYIKDNINEYQRFLNEYVAMYYVWKNNIKSKLIGFCHYRRIIPLDKVCYDLVTSENIQVFSMFNRTDVRYHHDIESVLQAKYQSICRFTKEYGQFDHIYNDIEEYIDSQNLLNPEQLKEITTYKYFYNSIFISREMFICTWEDFDKMMRFISGYVNHILTKYDINSFDDFKNHIQNAILIPYKNAANDQEKHFFAGFIGDKSSFVRKNIDDLSGNHWRIYAYIIEQLISVFIVYHHIITTNLIEFTVSSNFDRQWHLLYKNFTRTGVKNVLVGCTIDNELIKMINFYIHKNHANCKLIPNNDTISKYDICECLEQRSDRYINREVFFKYKFTGEGKFEYMLFDAHYMNLDDFVQNENLLNNIDDNCTIHFYHICESEYYCKKFIDYLKEHGYDVTNATFFREDNTYIFKLKSKGGN